MPSKDIKTIENENSSLSFRRLGSILILCLLLALILTRFVYMLWVYSQLSINDRDDSIVQISVIFQSIIYSITLLIILVCIFMV